MSDYIDHATCSPGEHDFEYSDELFAGNEQNHDGDRLLCNDCRAPIFYCTNDENWHHAGADVPSCFLIQEVGQDVEPEPSVAELSQTPVAIAEREAPEPLNPSKGVPFAEQSDEFRVQQYVTTVSGFVAIDKSDLTLAQKIDWYVEHGVSDADAAMRPQVRDIVAAKLGSA